MWFLTEPVFYFVLLNATKDFCLSFLLVCWEVGATQGMEILTNQSHHHTDGSQQNGKTNKKEPTQTSAGEAANAKAEVEFCLPLEPKLINFKIHFTLILQSKWLLTLIFSFLSVQMWSHVSN